MLKEAIESRREAEHQEAFYELETTIILANAEPFSGLHGYLKKNCETAAVDLIITTAGYF